MQDGKRNKAVDAVYPVRLPKDMIEKFPAAKIRTGKKIQEFIRDAIGDNLRRLNL